MPDGKLCTDIFHVDLNGALQRQFPCKTKEMPKRMKENSISFFAWNSNSSQFQNFMCLTHLWFIFCDWLFVYVWKNANK